MTYIVYLLAGIFLPLFPLSMPFNLLYARVRHPFLRGLLLLSWPQIGVAIIFTNNVVVPSWLIALALLTSLLYALRSLALRDLALWTSFFATSAWALLWILFDHGVNVVQLHLIGLGVSAPLLLMAMLGAGLERRFGAAYLGLYGGLAHSIPRFSGVLVVVVLAIIATPLFPTFFAMLSLIITAMSAAPLVAVGIASVWLLWSWAGARLLQGLIVGPQDKTVEDLSQTSMWLYIAVLVALVFAGIYWLGGLT